jgi:TPR repeat protein
MKKQLFLLLICSLLITGAKANLPVYHSVAVQTIDDPATEALFKKAMDYYKAKDYTHALPLFKQAGEKGHAESLYYIGIMYYYGKGVRDPKDHSTSTKWFKQAAEKGNALAQCMLSTAYNEGYGVPIDKLEGFKWLEKAAEQGVPGAQTAVASYYYGDFVPKDILKAKRLCEAAMEGNRSEVERILRLIRDNYGDVITTNKNTEEDTMSADEAFDMGYKYDEEKDYQKAIKYYKIAVEKGSIAAAHNLGTIYFYGYGVEKDYATAFRLYMDAAKRGSALSQCMLGYMYYNGCGVNKDDKQAFEWSLKAAEQNNAAAQCFIGYLYYDGEGVTKNYASALKWSLKAAEQGNAVSQYLVGLLYSDEDNNFYNVREACKWMEKAANSDSDISKKAAKKLSLLEIQVKLLNVKDVLDEYDSKKK